MTPRCSVSKPKAGESKHDRDGAATPTCQAEAMKQMEEAALLQTLNKEEVAVHTKIEDTKKEREEKERQAVTEALIEMATGRTLAGTAPTDETATNECDEAAKADFVVDSVIVRDGQEGVPANITNLLSPPAAMPGAIRVLDTNRWQQTFRYNNRPSADHKGGLVVTYRFFFLDMRASWSSGKTPRHSFYPLE